MLISYYDESVFLMQITPSSNNKTLESLSVQLGQILRQKNWIITTAESCTGGGIAQAITETSGSSHWFSHGFITYSNLAKQQLLNVCANDIERYGAVSGQVAEAMATGALAAAQADIAIAVTGVAGPAGGSEEKPVGTVWIAWATRDELIASHRYLFSGDRKVIRNQSVIEAISGVITLLAQ